MQNMSQDQKGHFMENEQAETRFDYRKLAKYLLGQ